MNIQQLDISLDPSKEEIRQAQIQAKKESYQDRFGRLDLVKSYKPLFELLWYSQMPCFDVRGLTSEVKDENSFLKRCYWKGTQINCNAIFQKRPTNKGMCCSFNMDYANSVLKQGQYKESIALRQSVDAQKGFESPRTPYWYRMNKEPYPENGIENGLTIVVDRHSDKLSAASVPDNFRGFPILVHHKSEFPSLIGNEILARPGYESRMKVNALHLEANEDIRKHHPHQRKCFFPDEFPNEHKLKMHHYYSQSNCIFECEIEFAAKCLTWKSHCKQGQICDCKDHNNLENILMENRTLCFPWYYPSTNEQLGELCDPWNTKKFRKILKNQIPKGLCRHCYPDCSRTKYETSLSYAEFEKCDDTTIGGTNLICDLMTGDVNPATWVNIAQNEYRAANESIPWYLDTTTAAFGAPNKTTRFSNLRTRLHGGNKVKKVELFAAELKKNPFYDAYERDIGIITVYFSDKKISKFVTESRYTIHDFLYQIGGSLGFMMGVSMFSIVEIIYWIGFRLFC